MLMFNKTKNAWIDYYRNKKVFLKFIISVLLFIVGLVIYSNFLIYNESRSGTILQDPILILFSPVNLTWLIFGILYISIALSLVYLSAKPYSLTLTFYAYFILILFRITAMYLVPLEPPPAMLALKDPVVESLGTGVLLTKDLFFSGHTSLLFLLFLIIENRYFKYLLLIGTIVVGCSVLLQHVHYSIDVLVAPFFSYVSVKIAKKVNLNR